MTLRTTTLLFLLAAGLTACEDPHHDGAYDDPTSEDGVDRSGIDGTGTGTGTGSGTRTGTGTGTWETGVPIDTGA